MEVPDQTIPAMSVVPEGFSCKHCGYALQGLVPTGMCPECGLPIERSLSDDLLRNSNPDYLRLLHRGVFLVLTGIILYILMMIGGIAVGFMVVSYGGNLGFVEMALTLCSLIATGVIAWGWFEFSTPDPAFVGRQDGSQARVVVRVAVVANAGIALLTSVIQLAMPSSATTPSGGAPNALTALDVVVVLLSLVGFVAWAVSFFAAMLYLRWLCPRIPNWKAYRRAKTMMWLGPVLFTVGALCVGLGPLVALILYWNMLDWIRRDLKRIRAEQAVGAGLV